MFWFQQSASLRFTAAALLSDDFLTPAVECDPTGKAVVEVKILSECFLFGKSSFDLVFHPSFNPDLGAHLTCPSATVAWTLSQRPPAECRRGDSFVKVFLSQLLARLCWDSDLLFFF